MEAPLNKNRGQQGNRKSDSLHYFRAFRRESAYNAYTATSWDANAHANTYADSLAFTLTDTARL